MGNPRFDGCLMIFTVYSTSSTRRKEDSTKSAAQLENTEHLETDRFG